MATDTLQTESAPATPNLAGDFEALAERVRRMENLLRGAESVLSSIRYDGELCYTPADEHRIDTHRRAYGMIEFLGEQLQDWRKVESDADDFVSDQLRDLAKAALKPRLSPVT